MKYLKQEYIYSGCFFLISIGNGILAIVDEESKLHSPIIIFFLSAVLFIIGIYNYIVSLRIRKSLSKNKS